jgi:hypothetical protein
LHITGIEMINEIENADTSARMNVVAVKRK